MSKYCRSPALASSWRFLFHSCSTSQQQLDINSSLPVDTLIPIISEGRLTLATTRAPGRAGAGACSSWPTVLWPVDRLSLPQIRLENLIIEYARYMRNMKKRNMH